MALTIRAVYGDGRIRPLDPIDLPEGQMLNIRLEPLSEKEAIRAALGDLVIWANQDDDSDAWVEAEAEAIAETLKGDKPLSDLVIEDRDET